MFRSPLFHYVLWFIYVKCSNMGKNWDYVTAGIVALVILLVSYSLWNLLMSLLRNGKDGIAFASIMIFGLGYWLFGEITGIKWILEFGNPVLDNLALWTMGIFAVGLLIFSLRIIFYSLLPEKKEIYEEEEE